MMGKKARTGRKVNFQLFFCVVVHLILSAADICETSAVLLRNTSEVKPAEDPGPLREEDLLSDGGSGGGPDPPGALSQSDTSVQDVSVACGSSDFVLRVRAAFFGLGADPSELRIGDGQSCMSNAVLGPDLFFRYPLTACGHKLQWLPGYLTYKFVLHYVPSPKRFPNTGPLTVNIECRYPTNYHMYKLAVQPTWASLMMHRTLKTNQNDFQIQLMDDKWENPVHSRVFQLREMVNFQVTALHLPPGHKLYIDSCFATPNTHLISFIRFPIIDNHGCLLDSRMDPGASKFISRTDESVRFSIKAFQFVINPDSEISMHCQIHVTATGPSHAHKSCTYMVNSWKALSGHDAICACCDSLCVTPQRDQAMMDGVISSESLWVSSHSDTTDPEETKKHKEDTSGVTDLKDVEEKLKWSANEKAKVIESRDDILDLEQEDQKWKNKALKEEPLDTEGKEESQKPGDGKVKAKSKEMEQDNDEKTWYFAW